MQHFLDALRSDPTLGLALLCALLGLLCAALLVRVERLKDRLHRARIAAEDAARAAALAAPGGIDEAVVMEMLNRGERPTLDNVYAAMQRRDAANRRAV
ncbi:MAG: hypothetical protein ACYDAC_07725 [Candidatus Dormibacteria bacterium]